MEYGAYYFRCAFQMSYSSFWKLENLLRPLLRERKYDKAWNNGPILPSVRVACALQYFAGAAAYDIAFTFGIVPSEVFKSIWEVVDAINCLPQFDIQYPDCHKKQAEIAHGFENKSEANFNCCAGAMDGILIWIHCPSKKCCDEAACDAGKFFCGQKLKYGLNCQAVCDSQGHFIDFSILFPDSMADCLAFEGMSLHQRLQEGLLASGLSLFGNNAYLNCPFMVTPFSGTALTTSKDAFNFYQSQLRILIECAFGKFTQQWGILQSVLPKRVSVKKTIALVLAMAKLHNYCTDS